MTLKPLAAFATALLGMAMLSTSLSAYSLLGYSWAQPVVPYYINPANQDLPTSAIEPAIRAGADAWRLQSGASFAFAFAGYSAQTSNTNDGINLIMFRNAASGSAIATTYTWFSGTRMLEADIVFWDGGFQFFTGSTGCSNGFYIEDIAAHEFGHFLGLGHSAVTSATMFPSVSACAMGNRTLDPDDIAGVEALSPPVSIPVPPPPTGFHIVP